MNNLRSHVLSMKLFYCLKDLIGNQNFPINLIKLYKIVNLYLLLKSEKVDLILTYFHVD